MFSGTVFVGMLLSPYISVLICQVAFSLTVICPMNENDSVAFGKVRERFCPSIANSGAETISALVRSGSVGTGVLGSSVSCSPESIAFHFA